jgi:N-acetylglutamate synthase-like GNAT family acetyltransferase
MQIVRFDGQHVDGIADLIVPIQRNEFGLSITYQDQPDLTDIPGFYQSGAGQFWLALEDEKVIGTIALRDIGNDEAALRKMFVASDYRGSEHGVAAKLLATLIAHAKEQKLRAIYLGTTDKFLAAHRFYEKNGFELIEAESLPASFPRMKVDTRFYRLAPPGS